MQRLRSRTSSLADEVTLYREGDPSVAETLARRAARLALRTAAAIVSSRDEANDIAQDVAVDVLSSLGKLRDPSSFDAWVHRITVRHALRHLKRRRRVNGLLTSSALLDERTSASGLEEVDRDALLAVRQALAAALASLPAKQRVALALRYVHDLSDEEIAAAVGCRTGTVHSLLSRGRESLRRNSQLAELALAFDGGRT